MKQWKKVAVAVPGTLVGASLVLVGVAAGNGAGVVAEHDDAGELPATAQVLSDAVGAVTGTVAHDEDIDLYRFCAGDQGFSVSTVNGDTEIDTQLFVFHGDGAALAHNDDRDGTWRSRVTFGPGEVPAGEYLVAVGSWSNTARNAAGESLFPATIGKQVGPAPGLTDTILDHWGHHGSSSGDYRIDFTGTAECGTSDPVGPAGFALDVKPGSDENPINTRAPGRTPIALLGSDDFDPSTVAPESVLVGPGSAGLAGEPSLEDVDGDGHLDLVGHVHTDQLGLAAGDTELCVDATAADTALRGCDTVRVR